MRTLSRTSASSPLAEDSPAANATGASVAASATALTSATVRCEVPLNRFGFIRP